VHLRLGTVHIVGDRRIASEGPDPSGSNSFLARSFQSDMAELHHECGIAAAYWRSTEEPLAHPPLNLKSPDQVARLIPRMLLDMQNRGQLAAGMSSYSPGRSALLATHKDLGTVAEAFRLNAKPEFEALMSHMGGPAAIGHVRYATCGSDDREAAQPFERDHGRKFKWFAFAFNGQLTNYPQLKRSMLADGDYHLKRDLDTEIILHSISHELQGSEPPIDWVEVFRKLARKFDGAYNIVLLTAAGEMIVARDPLGIRPLCVAEEGPLFAAASESVPLANLGFHRIRSLEPGQMAIVSPTSIRYERFAESPRHSHCFFEWIYFANVASTLDDRSVYLSRAMLGRELARLEDVPLDADTIVVPVPDTAKAAADAMAYSLGVPSVEGLMRNRYLGRTFIEGTADRASKARLKYTPLPDVLSGKRVLLVEDSIVRSTTMRALVHEIRNRGGAREIHLRIACPPIIAPCYYGIDMSQRSELFAPKFLDASDGALTQSAQAEMAADLGADSLRYLPVDALARSVGLPPERLCQACVTGDYPTRAGQELYQLDLGIDKVRQRRDYLPAADTDTLLATSAGKRAYESE
jgi:amidophosphoribosyltransferase